MAVEIKVPSFPESVSDGTLVAWHKQAGDAVKRDETLADIETDKVVFEIPALEDGVVEEILAAEGSTVVSGQVIARIGERATDQPAKKPQKPKTTKKDRHNRKQRPFAVAPAANRLLVENDLDSDKISGTGKDGRILKEDVLRFLAQQKAAELETAAPVTEKPVPKEVPTVIPDGRPEKRVPMTRLRARIAERLVEAQQISAILSTFNEVNMQSVMELRQHYRDRFEKLHGVRLGFMSFFVKAVVEALKDFPEVNASIDGKDIVYHGFFDIGIAVSTSRGLVVPVLRDADQLSMAEIEIRIREFSDKAESGKLSMEEITGGTFTITNGGVFGSLLSTPILNPPQSAILGMHKIQERPVVEDGKIIIRPMMYLALSYDHRLIDGRGAVQFLLTIKEVLEDPARMLLEI